mmetsp:Transcript_110771/g.236615  ORF Transcript_110771/g.236615 Transcript_110771/m.236615 type:complete len:424 (-) Transcript_110771:178-1449(-)
MRLNMPWHPLGTAVLHRLAIAAARHRQRRLLRRSHRCTALHDRSIAVVPSRFQCGAEAAIRSRATEEARPVATRPNLICLSLLLAPEGLLGLRAAAEPIVPTGGAAIGGAALGRIATDGALDTAVLLARATATAAGRGWLICGHDRLLGRGAAAGLGADFVGAVQQVHGPCGSHGMGQRPLNGPGLEAMIDKLQKSPLRTFETWGATSSASRDQGGVEILIERDLAGLKRPHDEFDLLHEPLARKDLADGPIGDIVCLDAPDDHCIQPLAHAIHVALHGTGVHHEVVGDDIGTHTAGFHDLGIVLRPLHVACSSACVHDRVVGRNGRAHATLAHLPQKRLGTSHVAGVRAGLKPGVVGFLEASRFRGRHTSTETGVQLLLHLLLLLEGLAHRGPGPSLEWVPPPSSKPLGMVCGTRVLARVLQ